jgi:hypothetical protein
LNFLAHLLARWKEVITGEAKVKPLGWGRQKTLLDLVLSKFKDFPLQCISKQPS